MTLKKKKKPIATVGIVSIEQTKRHCSFCNYVFLCFLLLYIYIYIYRKMQLLKFIH